MLDLNSLFAELQISSVSEDASGCYHTIPIRNGGIHLLAKLANGYPCVLIGTRTIETQNPPPIRLERVSVQHGVTGIVHGRSFPDDLKFSVICLTSSDSVLVTVFLRFAVFLCNELNDTPTSKDVAGEMRHLVEMLQALRQPSRQTIQGLWGELFLINAVKVPAKCFNAWHSDPLELHDFHFPEGRLEVKSASGGLRKHRFSHRQLWPPTGKPFAVASVLVDSDPNGLNVFDLGNKIRSHLTISEALRLDRIMMETLGSDFPRADEFRFNQDAARMLLRFFLIGSIPRLPEDVPAAVSEISYCVTFSPQDGLERLDWLEC